MPFRLDIRLKLLEVRKKSKLQHLIPNFSPGFTLIELLVVIGIMAILSSIAFSIAESSRAKGRDSNRKSTLENVKKAADLARLECTNHAYYPYMSGTASVSFTSLVNYLGTNNYFDSTTMPSDDPSFPKEYYSFTDASHLAQDSACPQNQKGVTPQYILFRVKLEKGTQDPQSTASKTKCQSIIDTLYLTADDGYYYLCD